MGYKTVRITDETYERIRKSGVFGETMDQVINKCLEAYEKIKK